MKYLLKGGTVVSAKGCRMQDVLMEEGVITRVGMIAEEGLSGDVNVEDVSGKLLFPGFIDAHTHFDLEVSGTVTADDFYSGTRAAVSGGTTMVIDFATQNKGETLREAFTLWQGKAAGKSSCDYGFHMAVSDWNDTVSSEMEEMIREGVTSFKVYMTYDAMVLSDKELYQVLKRLKEVGGIAGVHCENKGIIDALVEEEKKAGHMDVSAHPRTRPAEAEAEAVSRLLRIAALVDTAVIVVHLSSMAAYQEIKNARERGQEVFVETCPQYLLLGEERYMQPFPESAKYVAAPPLRSKEDRNGLWNALKKDNIQTVSTDHCSFTLEQKAAGTDDFTKIPCGMPGVETRPVLMYTYGVLGRGLTAGQMCGLLSEHPAKLYGLYPQKGCIAQGSDADIVVWDPGTEWELGMKNQLAAADYCPFEGFPVRGRAAQVYLRGELAAEDGKIVQEKQGTYIPRKKWMEL